MNDQLVYSQMTCLLKRQSLIIPVVHLEIKIKKIVQLNKNSYI